MPQGPFRDPGKAGRNKDMKLSGRKDPVLDEEEVSGLLREIFEESGARPNSVPLEALRAYTAYRRERFYILRGILAAILVLFFLMPFLFIEMKLTVSPEGPGFRKLPVYTLDVESPVPVRCIKADMKQRQLPIYEESARTYTVEPIRNGLLKIEVMGVNRQKASVSVEVTDVDSAGPKLLSGGEEDGLVYLYVRDDGIGVDYSGVYALTASGRMVFPRKTVPEENCVVFEYPSETLDVYIPDYIGNTLHLALRIEE